MVMVSKHGLTMLGMKATMNMERNMVLELSSGLTVLLTSVNSITTIYMEKESIHGQTTESLKVTGEPTKCTARALSNGLTEESTSANTRMIRKKAMESSSGPMVDAIEASGFTANNTEKELTSLPQAKKNTESGRMGNESGGLVEGSKNDSIFI